MLAKIAKMFDGSHVDDLTKGGYAAVTLLIDEDYGKVDGGRCFKYVDTWTEWDGAAPCPIDEEVILHEVRFKDGSVHEGMTPKIWDWYRYDQTDPCNIIAYRILG